MPADHNFRFEPRLLRRSLEAHGRIESLTGLSLLWGFPRWGQALEKLNPATARWVLASLDRAARIIPSWADVLVAIAVPRGS
jgi:hypothetical protein